jgi:hypothetical protein
VTRYNGRETEEASFFDASWHASRRRGPPRSCRRISRIERGQQQPRSAAIRRLIALSGGELDTGALLDLRQDDEKTGRKSFVVRRPVLGHRNHQRRPPMCAITRQQPAAVLARLPR